MLEVLARLDAARARYRVHGGWGMEALLGEVSREHDDLDLAVDAGDIARAREALAEFHVVPERDEGPGNYVIEDARGRQIDLHVLAFDERGDGWMPRMHGRPPARWPAGGLAGTGRLGGRAVRCTTPEFELASHQHPARDDVDLADAERLSERFGLPRPGGERTGYIHPKRSRARSSGGFPTSEVGK